MSQSITITSKIAKIIVRWQAEIEGEVSVINKKGPSFSVRQPKLE
jgi:hypothetical protein